MTNNEVQIPRSIITAIIDSCRDHPEQDVQSYIDLCEAIASALEFEMKFSDSIIKNR